MSISILGYDPHKKKNYAEMDQLRHLAEYEQLNRELHTNGSIHQKDSGER